MLTPYSSRRTPLDHGFLRKRLENAVNYDRIAGYFSSSLLEVAGEGIEALAGKARIICNSELQPDDVATAKLAQASMTREWRHSVDQQPLEQLKPRLRQLHDLLVSGKIEVRVLPDKAFGLLHGKAGVITYADGTRSSFLGSVNESRTAWKVNYELLWEDSTPSTVEWVQEEFESLWNDPHAKPLAELVVKDIARLSERRVITHDDWERAPKAAEAIVESPIYRKHLGLWAYQKSFVDRAFHAHVHYGGARFVLADQVGLGKTVQMALTAMLCALYDKKPALVIAPKTLIYQWQEELMKLLGLPSAVWTGKAWLDENGMEHVNTDSRRAITKCPRRIGIVSQGLVTARSADVDELLKPSYSCVVVDEAHRSRRSNSGKPEEKADPNNLMRYLHTLSSRTRSMIMGTATPVQLHPIEAYDLLSVLGAGGEQVIGNEWSEWRRTEKKLMFEYVLGERDLHNEGARWQWIRNPVPPKTEKPLFALIRNELGLLDEQAVAELDQLSELGRFQRKKLNDEEYLLHNHNPFVRHIVRRTRKFLEEKIDPKTGEPYLPRVAVELFPKDNQGILLPGYLSDAYTAAEDFCKALGSIMKGAGFTRMLLLRRMGSSLEAGRRTALTFAGLAEGQPVADDEDSDDDALEPVTGIAARLGEKELAILSRLIAHLDTHTEADPKLERLEQILFRDHWLERGCIIFSQYYDTVRYFSEQLSLKHPALEIGVYAGAGKSGRWLAGSYRRDTKEQLKADVQDGKLTLLFGTDSASEGLNLQRLGSLINIDLPWNPTRLEQRKGRIQRIGQRYPTVWVYNMRYRGSVEDRVHTLLSDRLEEITNLFGQIPDVLEDVWIDVAKGELEAAKHRIRSVPQKSPFELRYDKIDAVDFETCTRVLEQGEVVERMRDGW